MIHEIDVDVCCIVAVLYAGLFFEGPSPFFQEYKQ